MRYRSIRSDVVSLRETMWRHRFGYRRIHVMLRRRGIVMNQEMLRRLHREESVRSVGAEAASERSTRGIPS